MLVKKGELFINTHLSCAINSSAGVSFDLSVIIFIIFHKPVHRILSLVTLNG